MAIYDVEQNEFVGCGDPDCVCTEFADAANNGDVEAQIAIKVNGKIDELLDLVDEAYKSGLREGAREALAASSLSPSLADEDDELLKAARELGIDLSPKDIAVDKAPEETYDDYDDDYYFGGDPVLTVEQKVDILRDQLDEWAPDVTAILTELNRWAPEVDSDINALEVEIEVLGEDLDFGLQAVEARLDLLAQLSATVLEGLGADVIALTNAVNELAGEQSADAALLEANSAAIQALQQEIQELRSERATSLGASDPAYVLLTDDAEGDDDFGF